MSNKYINKQTPAGLLGILTTENRNAVFLLRMHWRQIIASKNKKPEKKLRKKGFRFDNYIPQFVLLDLFVLSAFPKKWQCSEMETVAESLIMMLVYVLFVSAHCAAPCLLQFVSLTTHANIHRCDMFQHLSDEGSLLCLEVTKNQI